jgi:tetratricopeptide (TPR) repeat protein
VTVTERRYRALLLGNWEFPQEPQQLRALIGPPTDLRLLRAALTDSAHGLYRSGDVTVLRNAPVMRMRQTIEVFIRSGRSEDQLLIYYSGHGLREESGSDLYLCAYDTSGGTIRSTTVHASDIAEQLRHCRAAASVVLLDCCFSGNYQHKGGSSGTVLDGRGIAVLTSSQIDRTSRDAEEPGRPSQFTGHLVAGLRGATGEEPARDYQPGGREVTLEDLHEYVDGQMRAEGPHRPTYSNRLVGRVLMARGAGRTTPGLPPEESAAGLRAALQSIPTNRFAAVRSLRELSRNGDDGWALLAGMRLGALAADDDHATAIEAYRKVADAGHPEWSPEALYRLGLLLEADGDLTPAAEAWRRAAEFDHPAWAPAAAHRLGRLLARTPTTIKSALRYYRQALGSARAGSVSIATEFVEVLDRAGEADEARALRIRVARGASTP